MASHTDYSTAWEQSYGRRENYVFYPSEEVVRFIARHIRKRIGHDEFVELVPGARGARIVDVGCGIGRHLVVAHEMGLEPHGVDLSATAVAVAREHLRRRGVPDADARVVIGSATRLPWADGFFAHAMSVSALDSMPFDQALPAAAEIARVTAPGGLFHCDLISGDETGRSPDFDGEVVVQTEHERDTIQSYFNHAKIVRLLDPHFEILECELVTRQEVLQSTRRARWFVTARRRRETGSASRANGVPLTVVTYHYVRPIAGSAHPGIKGLEVADFRGQLDFLARHYDFVDMDDCLAALRGERPLPDRPVLLTFDDGYADHYHQAFTELRARGIRGAFFVPACAITDHRVLDVHKIHFVLANCEDATPLVERIDACIREHARARRFPTPDELQARHAVANDWDSAETVYVKRMLQHILPPDLRAELVTELFRRFVTDDESRFARELYLSRAQIAEMADAGMHFGGHGLNHVWLDRIPDEEKAREIRGALDFLREVVPGQPFQSFCYPHGAFDARTVELLRSYGVPLGFCDGYEVARLSHGSALTLTRLDTNHLPKTADAPPNEWYAKG